MSENKKEEVTPDALTDMKKDVEKEPEVKSTEDLASDSSVPKSVDMEKTGTAEQAPKKNLNKTLLVAGCLIILLFIAAAVGYYFYDQSKDSDSSDDSSSDEGDGGEEPAEEDVEDLADAELDEFDGSYVTAELPSGWTIVEYEDGAGDYGLLSDGTYDGLTAIVIRDSYGEDVFTIEATNGIGGIDACQVVYRFPDTSAAYVTDMLATSVEVYPGAVAQNVVGDYDEFTLVGKEGRVIGSTIYWDSSEGVMSFDPHCNNLINFPDEGGLSFHFTNGSIEDDSTSYMIKVTDELADDAVPALVGILESMEVE